MKLLLIALLLMAPPADDSDLVKAAKKKPAKGVITNDVVKKNATPSGKSTATAAAAPNLIAKSDEQIQAEQKLLRDAASIRLHAAEDLVAALERELALVELSYYAENDPDVRDRDITTKFVAAKAKLAEARKALAVAREEAAKLQLKNVIVHEAKDE